MKKSVRLRWKREPRETGLRSVGAGPRGSILWDGVTRLASTQALGGGWHGPVRGWFWTCPNQPGIEYENTCGNPTGTEEEAKAQALAYISASLAKLVKP
jgi:hypothetical protein